MTRIFGLTVVRNEAERYLSDCLSNNAQLFPDGVFAWDDASDDDTVEICRKYGCSVRVRPDGVPSFIEHEGRFRAAAWSEFEKVFAPKVGDWVFAFDADEFIVAEGLLPRVAIERAIQKAEKRGASGVIVPFPEVFDVVSGVPQVRIDGLWGQVRGPRLFAYRPDAVWSDKPMGCGSEPQYVVKGPLSKDACGISVLHYGYANRADHKMKHERYTSLYDHGHNDSHIQSIIKEPTLTPWRGPIPVVGRFA